MARYKRITSASDDGLVAAGPSVTLEAIVVGVDSAGITLALHDCAVEGDATAGNRFGTVELDTRDTFPYGVRCNLGLVVIASGACDITVCWS